MSRPNEFDEELLTSVLSDFAHTLTRRFDVAEVLFRLVEHVTEILRVDGAGVSLVDEEGRLRRVTTVNELTARLESVEEETQEGPCVDAFRRNEVVAVADLAAAGSNWPRWAAEADGLGVAAVLGVPLSVHDRVLGAMNVYSRVQRPWSDGDVRVARVLTDMAASYVANASDLERSRRTAEQLQEALDSRIVIEQAKGVLVAEEHVSVDDAFVILRTHSRNHGASLRDVANAVVHLGLRPSLPRRRGKS